MPLVSKIYSFVSTFISSMILPTTEKGMGGYIFGRFWQNIVEGFFNFFYAICKWFLAFMDFLQYFIQKLIGLDYWLETTNDGRRTLTEAASEDMIFKFLYADSVQKVFRALCAVFIILLIIFTIFQIVKSEWDFMTGDGKGGNSKAAIFRSSIKAIVLVIAFPILLVMGIISSNAILASIVKAVGVDMSETFGGKIFSISAQPANKYRHYADANTYLPTTDQVTFYLNIKNQVIAFGDAADDAYHDYYSDYKEYVKAAKKGREVKINSIFDPLVPRNEEKFSGFCFRIDDEDGNFNYYFVKASSNRDDIYYYLTRCVGAQVLSKNASWAYDEVGKALIDGIGSNFNSTKNDGCYITNLNIQKGNDTVRQVCRNSWNYSLIYVSPKKKLSQTVTSLGNQNLSDYDLGTGFGAFLYNSDHISAYFDGGQFGVVQSMAEYSVMADVVDFMCDNALTFYIMDVTSPLIDWNYHYDTDGDGVKETSYMIGSRWISSNVSVARDAASDEYFLNEAAHATTIFDNETPTDPSDDTKALTFLTKYSNNYALPAESEQDIIYTASFTAGNELEGSRYIICLRGDTNFFPLVNGAEITINDKDYTFSSPQYASEYTGVVWAKGTFDTNTVDGFYGNPTYLKNTSTFDNGKEKNTADSDGSYYYQISVDEVNKKGTLKFYDYYTQRIGSTLYAYNEGNLYPALKDTDPDTSVSIDTSNADEAIKVSYSRSGEFSCTYELKPTGKENGNYKEYASATKGICYVVYYNGTSVNKLDPNTGSLVGANGSLRPCYISSAGTRVAGDLAVKTYEITDIEMNTSDAGSLLKNTFSIFSGEEYVGTFTKKGLVEVAGFSEIAGDTKVFEANWGGKYYNMDIQGTITKETAGGNLQGKFNNTLQVADAKLKTMLTTFEATQASDSVTCYRNQIENYSGNSFGSILIEINVALFRGIYEFKTGVVQQVSDAPFASTTFTYAGANSGLTFDYFFDQNIGLRTFYSAFKINYVLLLVSSVLIIKVLFSALWGVIKRFYMITLYYLAMPVAASTMPVDGGSRFGNIRNQITGEVLSTYGVLIGLNLFFVLLSPIKDISKTIFTDEMIANSGSYFLKKLPISATMLNEFIYVLFLLVAFTLIQELPNVIQTMIGKGKSLDQTGKQVQQSVKTTMGEAGKMISGKSLKESVGTAFQMVPGFIPGSAIIGGAAKKTAQFVGGAVKWFGEGVASTARSAFGGGGGSGGGAPSGGAPSGGGGGDGSQNNRENEEGENEQQNPGGTEAENAREDSENENAPGGGDDTHPLDEDPEDDGDGDGSPLGLILNAASKVVKDVHDSKMEHKERKEQKDRDARERRESREFEERQQRRNDEREDLDREELEEARERKAENARESVDEDGNPVEVDEDGNPVGGPAGSINEARVREIVREELGNGGGSSTSAENAREGDDTDKSGENDEQKPGDKDEQKPGDKDEQKPGDQEPAGSPKATEEEIKAREELKGHRFDLFNADKDIVAAKMVLMNPKATEEEKEEARKNLEDAKERRSKAKEKISEDKQAVEASMSPERKAARKEQITNTVMNSIGAVATVAGTIAGGPIVGLLIHKTAKNLKKAAPGVINAVSEKYGMMKKQVAQFKEADGLEKAAMISGMAMKGAGVMAKGVLAAHVIGFAAPALAAVNSVTSAVGVPLWAVGATVLSGKLSEKMTGERSNGLSFINRGQGRVVQAGAGAGVPVSAENQREGEGTQQGAPGAPGTPGAPGAPAQNAGKGGSRFKMPEMTEAEKEAREKFATAKEAHGEAVNERKAAQQVVKDKEKEQEAADKQIKKNNKELSRLNQQIDESDWDRSKESEGDYIKRQNKNKEIKAKMKELEEDNKKQEDRKTKAAVTDDEKKAVEDAKAKEKDAKKAKTAAKKEVEENMSPERKQARREMITNTVMNSIGAVGTVAGTIAGGPIVGLLIHKTAKNLKKAAPKVVNAVSEKYGMMKKQVGDFKKADGLERAAMLSGMAMKGAGAIAKGVLIGHVAAFAAPAVKFVAAPALRAVNKVTSAVGFPLWAVGAAVLSGKLSDKITGAQASGGSFINKAQGRVVQAGAGAGIPSQPTQGTQGQGTQGQGTQGQTGQRPVTSGAPAAENARETNVGPSDEERQARADLKTHKRELGDAKSKRKEAQAEANAAQDGVDEAQAEVDRLREKNKVHKVSNREMGAAIERLNKAKKFKAEKDQAAEDAKNHEDELKGKITADKKAIEDSMTPERKAARRQQLTSAIIGGLGAAGTVAGTVLGGPIVGLLIHKTAKNIKKAAPAVLNAAGGKFAEFKKADGWGKAEILSGMAMKGAAIGAVGALVAPVAKFAMPAVKAVNEVTSKIGLPLWALGAAGLSGFASKKLSARMASSASFVNPRQARVLPTGSGDDIPQGTVESQGGEMPVAGARPVGGSRRSSGPVKMPAMTKAEKDARENFAASKEAHSEAVNERKAAQQVVKDKEKEQESADKQIKKNNKELSRLNQQIDESDWDRSKESEGDYIKRQNKNKEIKARMKELEDDNKKQEERKTKAAVTDDEKKAVEDAKAKEKDAKKAKTAAKKEIEENMSPERKQARREMITNTVMNSIGAVGTVAGTIAGGPIMGLIIHKTAKNMKRAAPKVMNAVSQKYGELKRQVGEFKNADGLGRAAMLSGMAMKGAGLFAGGVLAGHVAAYAAPAVKFVAAPALRAVNKITSAVGAPLWALGAMGLTGAIDRRLSGGSSFVGARRRFVPAGAGAEVPADSTNAQSYSQPTGFTTSPNTSVTRPLNVRETQNAFVYDESRIAEIVRRVLRGEDVLRSQTDKMQAAAHFVNYGSINDTAFVSNKNDAYRNAIVNSIETKGGKVVIGDAISTHAANAGVGVSDVLLHGYKNADGSEHSAMLSDASKLAIFKSMMTSEQLATLNQIVADKADDKDFNVLDFIQGNPAQGGLGMKMGVSYSQERGIEFTVNNATVRGKGAKNDAVNGALREVMNSGEISSEAVVDSISRTGYMGNATKAIARNYAITLDYEKEQSGNITGSAYHQVVFDKALKDEDLNAEAIYEYLKKDKDRLQAFNTEYSITEDTPMERILDTIKNGVKNPNSMFASIKPEEYSAELSTVVARHVADDTFKVQAFDMLSREQQLDMADHISANINGAASGAVYAYTDAERATRTEVSRKKMGDAELVNSFLNSNVEGKDQIINNMVGNHYGILDAENNFDPESENAKKMIAEINADAALSAKRDELARDGKFSTGDIVMGYAKAKVVGDTGNFETYVGNSSHDREVVETIMRGSETTAENAETKTSKKKSGTAEATSEESAVEAGKPLTNGEFVAAAMKDNAENSGEIVDRLVMDSVGLKHTNGVIDTTSDVYSQFLDEMTEKDENSHWGERLIALDSLDGAEAQSLVLGYAKAKVMEEQGDAKKMESFIGDKAGSRNQEVADRIAEASSVDPQRELDQAWQELELYGDLSDEYVRSCVKSKTDTTSMYNEVKAAMGYVEGGDAAKNAEIDDVASRYIRSNGYDRGILASIGVSYDSKEMQAINERYFKPSNETGLTEAEILLEQSARMDNPEEKARIETLAEMQKQGKTKESLYTTVDNLMGEVDRDQASATPGEFSNANARNAVNNLKAEYLVGDRPASRLNANIEGNYKAADVANYLRQVLPADQLNELNRDGAENGYSIMTSAQQNYHLATRAQNDEGARVILVNNKIDLDSLMQIAQFLNSTLGEALKERLISEISQELTALDLFAGKLGVDNAGVYSLVQKETTGSQDAELYEKAQGDLISMERVKAQAEESTDEVVVDSIARNATSRIHVLTDAEREAAEIEGTYDFIKTSDVSKKTAILGSENVRVAEKTGVYESVRARRAADVDAVEAELSADKSYAESSEREKRVRVADVLISRKIADSQDIAAGQLAGKKEAIRMISEDSEAGKRAVEIGAVGSRLSAVQSANESAMVGGGLERQRKVAEALWDDSEARRGAMERYRKEHRGVGLDTISEVDRNNYLFANYDKFLPANSDARTKVGEIMRNSQVSFENEATSGEIIKRMNQTEFDTVIRGMKTEGEAAVHLIKREIIRETAAGGELTEIPNESTMTKEELRTFNDQKSKNEQYYRKDNNAEVFAEALRNITLVNDDEIIREILSKGNPNISPEQLRAAREEALRNNGSFMGATIEAAMTSKGFEEILNKMKEYLKSHGNVDYDKLSTADRGRAITELLGNSDFLRSSKINPDDIRRNIESEFAKRASTATNYDVKQGIPSAQLLAFLRSAMGEQPRDQIMRITAHSPRHMFPRERYHAARTHYAMNNPMLRRLMIKMILRQLYREPELKRMIAADQSLYASEVKKMSRNEARKYINEHFGELSQKLGEKLLLQRDKNGTYAVRPNINPSVVNNAADRLERTDHTFGGKINEMLRAIAERVRGNSTDKNDSNKSEVDDIYNKLVGKLENDSEFKGIVQKIVKPTIQDQVSEFFNKGETQNTIFETSRKLSFDSVFVKNVFETANSNNLLKVKELENELDELKRLLSRTKK